MLNDYLTVKENGKSEINIEKSVFIASCKRVETAEQAREFINSVKKEYSNATHNCYCYKLKDGTAKFSDDGEPGSTAGLPILNAIESSKLLDVAVVVTRYFGGIKLGTGGLVRAYFSSAKSCLDKCGICKMTLSDVYVLELDYVSFSSLNSFFSSNGISVLNKEFSSFVTVTFACEKNKNVAEQISSIINKKPSIRQLKECFVEYK